MKKMFFLNLLLCPLILLGQSNQKRDSVYYLIDTTHVVKNDRMWLISTNDQYTRYIIKCPCLRNNGEPTFFHSNTEKGSILDRVTFKKLKMIDLSSLISLAKQTLDNEIFNSNLSFFLVQPKGKNYIIYNVNIMNPAITIVSGPDVMVMPPDTSAFTNKKATIINSKNVSNYLNQMVITSGRVLNISTSNKKDLLLKIGTDYLTEDFTVVIKEKNIKNFDSPFRYNHKLIKVVGPVILFEGKATIDINDDRYIKIIR